MPHIHLVQIHSERQDVITIEHMSLEQNVSAFVACKIVDYFFSMGKGTVTLKVATFMDAVIAGNTGYCTAKRRTHCHACRMTNPCRAFESCVYKWLCVKRVPLTVRGF